MNMLSSDSDSADEVSSSSSDSDDMDVKLFGHPTNPTLTGKAGIEPIYDRAIHSTWGLAVTQCACSVCLTMPVALCVSQMTSPTH